MLALAPIPPSPCWAWLGHLRGVAALLPSAPVPLLALCLVGCSASTATRTEARAPTSEPSPAAQPPAWRQHAVEQPAATPDATAGKLPTALRREPRSPDSGPPASSPCQVGVPECDDYLARYAACITSSPQVTGAARQAMERSLGQICSAWQQAARQGPASRQALAQACQTAATAAARAMASFGCKW